MPRGSAAPSAKASFGQAADIAVAGGGGGDCGGTSLLLKHGAHFDGSTTPSPMCATRIPGERPGPFSTTTVLWLQGITMGVQTGPLQLESAHEKAPSGASLTKCPEEDTVVQLSSVAWRHMKEATRWYFPSGPRIERPPQLK